MVILFVLLYVLVLGRLCCLLGSVIRSAEKTGEVGEVWRGDFVRYIPDTVPTEWIEAYGFRYGDSHTGGRRYRRRRLRGLT